MAKYLYHLNDRPPTPMVLVSKGDKGLNLALESAPETAVLTSAKVSPEPGHALVTEVHDEKPKGK